MNTILNIIWLVLGGLLTAIGWAAAGCVLCLTIVGIPLALQAFKMAKLTLTPFGTHVTYGGSFPSLLANVVWIVLIGLWEAIAYVALGVAFCLTVVGIPFGLQAFEMAKLSFAPFGTEVA